MQESSLGAELQYSTAGRKGSRTGKVVCRGSKADTAEREGVQGAGFVQPDVHDVLLVGQGVHEAGLIQ